MAPKHTTFHFEFENTKFFGQSWQPEKIEAVMVVVHGMGEHSGRYGTHFADAFCKKNIAIIAFDQFGHGKTEGKRGHTPGYNKNLDSITKILQIRTEIFGDIPTFLYGHSMGGNLVANYILKKPSNITGAIISSPMLKLAFSPPAWKMKIGSLLRNVYPSFSERTGLEVEAITRDAQQVDIYKKDPLNHDKITINYSLPFFEAGLWAIKNSAILNKKIFIFHGTGDRITDYKGTEAYAENSGENAKLKLYEGGYHELHNDTCKSEVLKDIVNWIESFMYTSFRL